MDALIGGSAVYSEPISPLIDVWGTSAMKKCSETPLLSLYIAKYCPESTWIIDSDGVAGAVADLDDDLGWPMGAAPV